MFVQGWHSTNQFMWYRPNSGLKKLQEKRVAAFRVLSQQLIGQREPGGCPGWPRLTAWEDWQWWWQSSSRCRRWVWTETSQKIRNQWRARRVKRLRPFQAKDACHDVIPNDWRRFKRLHPSWDLLNPHLTSFLMIGVVSNGYTPPGIC